MKVDKFFPEDFQYHQVCVLDNPNTVILPYFERATAFLHQAIANNGTCFVHCQRGVSRSASFVIAYLMKYFENGSMSAEQAIQFVKKKRKIVKPNSGFVLQLKKWEHERNIY